MEDVLLVHQTVSGLGVMPVAVNDGAGALAPGGREHLPVTVHGIWKLSGNPKGSHSMEAGAMSAGHLIPLSLTISY